MGSRRWHRPVRAVAVATVAAVMAPGGAALLSGRFRQLAPARRPVPIQLWNLRRIAVTAMLAASLAAGVAVFAGYMKVAGLL